MTFPHHFAEPEPEPEPKHPHWLRACIWLAGALACWAMILGAGFLALVMFA